MGPDQTRARACTGPRCGAVRRSVACAAAFGALLVTACSAPQSSAAPASPTTPTAASSTPTSSLPVGLSAADRGALAKRYLAIALPANRRLDADFDGLDDNDHDDLAAAAADLLAAAATERQFDQRLLRITLPPDIEVIARLMVAANQSRARLTDEAARSASLAQLRGYAPRLTAANAPVEEAVRVLRTQLGLPPPDTS
jgi:hypothetical protein